MGAGNLHEALSMKAEESKALRMAASRGTVGFATKAQQEAVTALVSRGLLVEAPGHVYVLTDNGKAAAWAEAEAIRRADDERYGL